MQCLLDLHFSLFTGLLNTVNVFYKKTIPSQNDAISEGRKTFCVKKQKKVVDTTKKW